MSKIEYKNRHGDKFTFSKTEDENILMEGDFEFMKIGYPNVYCDAYGEYIDNTNPKDRIPLKEFIDEIHREVYNENDEYIGRSEIGRKYGELVYSDTDTVDTIDPSGGPYLTRYLDMGSFDNSFKGMIIDQFKSVDEGYLIEIKK